MAKLVPIQEIADQYGVKRKSIRQAARRHEVVAGAIHETEEGVMVDAAVFGLWWAEQRDAHMDAVRQGRGA